MTEHDGRSPQRTRHPADRPVAGADWSGPAGTPGDTGRSAGNGAAPETTPPETDSGERAGRGPVVLPVTSVPDDETSAPGHETTVRDDETPLAEDQTTAPEDETSLPHDEATAPEDETALPHNETTAPEDETALPHNETTAPEDETARHDDEDTVEPSAGGVALIAPEDADRLHSGWRDVKAAFVDDPSGAVRQAGTLAEEAVAELTAALTRLREGLDGRSRDTGEADTERLRLLLRDYGSLLTRVLTR